MEIYLILKGTAMVIGATATLITAASAAWPKREGRVTRTLDRLSPIRPGALYRWLKRGNGMPANGGNGSGQGVTR